MSLKKSILATAIVATLNTGITEAAVIDMQFEGLFTALSSAGKLITNDVYPYYYDPTWGYGRRTQISGSLSYNTNNNTGSVAINPFHFFADTFPAIIEDFEFKSAGNGLLVSNMTFNWQTNTSSTTSTMQTVLDASGLLAEINAGVTVGDIFDANSCASSAACVLPASDALTSAGNQYPIGLVPIATSTFNTSGQTGFSTTLAQLSLGTDDGIGGSPIDNGPFLNYSFNFDLTSLTVTEVSAVPIPAAVWLFGSGSLALLGFARRRKI